MFGTVGVSARYVRNTTARAFAVVASALGIPSLLLFLRAVCQSKKSWQARHTGIKIIQQIAILMVSRLILSRFLLKNERFRLESVGCRCFSFIKRGDFELRSRFREGKLMAQGCGCLPHLKQLVDIIAHGLQDEQQKVRTITALALAALAEVRMGC